MMIYRFDEFEVDTDRFELRRAGAPRPVEPLVFDLICFLAGNSGRVIGRSEIVDQVWKGRIVSDATISGCVKSARKALDDSGGDQSYIRTIRARGFQFVGAVERFAAAPAGAPAVEPDPPNKPGAPDIRPAQHAPDAHPVIAVLPFGNLSAEADEYFADGLTEDIITNLSRFRDLLVVGRTSTFQFKGQAVALPDLSARLNAGYVVEGSVRRAAGRVRITAQLVDTETGVHLWADKYDREMEDIFAVQDDVTRMIAATLGVTIQDIATQRALRKNPVELGAYDCVLRARRYTALLSPEMHAEARDLLEQAVAKDPGYAEAHALLANVILAEHRFDANPRPDPIGRALEAAERAVRLDPQSAYAHCWLGIVHFFRRENDKFEAEAERALSLNPNDPETLADIGHYLAFMGEFERGTTLSRRARRLNPLHPGWYYFSTARRCFAERDYRETLAEVERIAMPDFYWTYLLRAAAFGQLGDPSGEGALKRLFELKPDFCAAGELQKWNAASEDFEHLMDGLRKAGLSL